jgi:hypothetical protein
MTMKRAGIIHGVLLLFLSFGTHFLIFAQNDDIWYTSLSEAKKEANQSDKLIFVEFGTEYSFGNVVLAADVWEDEKVIEKLKLFVPVYLDQQIDRVPAYKYKIYRVPTLLVLEANGDLLLRLDQRLGKAPMMELLDIIHNRFQKIRHLVKTYEDQNSHLANYLFGEAYQEIAMHCSSSIKSVFIKSSKAYLKKVPLYEVKSDTNLAHKLRIRKMINTILSPGATLVNPKKLVKFAKSDKYNEENKSLALFGAILGFHVYHKRREMAECIDQLRTLKNGNVYLEQLKILSIL